jgi:hypothetical protein
MSELQELMRRAIAAQGKADPDEVFALAATIDLDDAPPGERHEPPPLDVTQEAFALGLEEGRAARDAALRRVDQSADPDWKAAARKALNSLIESGQPFTSDEVWIRVGFSPKEPRALGPLLRAEVDAGRIVRAGERQSKIAKRHARPLAVWRPT